MRPTLPKSLYNRIEEDVVKLHIDLGLCIPVRPLEVAERLGYIVKRFSEIDDPDVLAILNSALDENRDGLSYRDPELDTYVIWINDIDIDYEPRINFTIMHEIGHIRMGHKVDSPLAEMIANYYAAYALVPSPLPKLFNCSSFLEIMSDFEVSVDCAYNCAKRCINWQMYGGPIKEYEKQLIQYYQNHINAEMGGDNENE